jgi:hypothetical protein
MDSLFSSPSDNLHTTTINFCRTVRPNREKMLKYFGYKINLKRVTKTNVRCNLTAIVWKDTQNVDILMDMHSAPLEGNICNEHSKAVTLDI